MKTYIALFIILFFSNVAHSECAYSGIDFYPKQNEITVNSIFVIQGYHISQSIISSLKNRTVYLINENNDSTILIHQETLTSLEHTTQAIFFPSEDLKPNSTYHIWFSGQTNEETKQMYGYHKRRTVSWTTNSNKTKNISDKKWKFTLKKTEDIHYGCGPSINIKFKVNNDPKAVFWYKTELININNDVKQIFYIKKNDNYLSVGHGMCNGEFKIEKSFNYKVRFTPFNSNGQTLKTSDWQYFNGSFITDSD